MTERPQPTLPPNADARADGESAHKSLGGPRRLIHALRYSYNGLREAIRVEAAFRQELMLLAVLLPTALWLPVTLTERALLIGVLFIVLIVEILNSALEAVVDRISLAQHDLSRRAKDFGSAAVFLALTLTAIVWGLIAVPAAMRVFA
jgi:diacylglycerol kinase (ATP)